MPDTQNRNEDVFAKYNAMSTEELQQILREDASKPEGQEETSTEALFYIMEVLAQRRRARNEGKTPEEALECGTLFPELSLSMCEYLQGVKEDKCDD